MISVIICSYNRAESLRNTLLSLACMDVAAGCRWEVVVVDNNSTDDTGQVVAEFREAAYFTVRYFLERQQGLSYARNRGIDEAGGDVLAFIDDDVLLDRQWLNSIDTAFRDHGIACAGGRIYPHWHHPCPHWLRQELHGHLALLDLGEDKIRMTKPMLWGANLVFRASMFEKYGQFNTALGRTAGKLYGNEEVFVLQKLIDAGEGVYYLPEIVVHHCIGSNRMKKSYFRKWFFDAGELDGLQMGYYPQRNLIGIPYYMFKEAAGAVWRTLLNKLKRQENEFLSELALMRFAGFLLGRIKVHRALVNRPEAGFKEGVL